LEVVSEINFEARVGDSRGVNHQTIEGIEVWRVSLVAEDSGLRSRGKSSLDEILHFSGVGEGESGIGLKSDEDIIRVSIYFANLHKRSSVCCSCV
jgi:hypothetical protein